MSKIKRNCSRCARRFEVWPYKIRENKGIYCSVSCCRKDPVYREKIREANKKKIVSYKTRLKISNAVKRRYVNGFISPFQILKEKNPDWNKGENNYQWIVDRKKLSKSDIFRNSAAHREWSKQVKNRDYWKCQISNDDCSGRVEAHHILAWKDYPELRYEIKNGITLCHFHHPRKRMDEERYAPMFTELVAAKMQ